MKLLFSSLIALMLFSSCDNNDIENDQKFDVTFSFSKNDLVPITARVSEDINQIMVSVTDQDNNLILNKTVLDIFAFGDGYISETISLSVGDYNVTEFFIANADNEIQFSTPVSGSAKAHLVNNPLPLTFTVVQNQLEKISLEVISTTGEVVTDFGYASFDFAKVNPLAIYLAASVFDETAEDTFSLTEANISISGDGIILYASNLEAVFNQVFIDTLNDMNSTYKAYQITATKTDFENYSETFTHEEIKSFNERPLLITLYREDITSLD